MEMVLIGVSAGIGLIGVFGKVLQMERARRARLQNWNHPPEDGKMPILREMETPKWTVYTRIAGAVLLSAMIGCSSGQVRAEFDADQAEIVNGEVRDLQELEDAETRQPAYHRCQPGEPTATIGVRG